MHTTKLRRVGGSVMLAIPPAILDRIGTVEIWNGDADGVPIFTRANRDSGHPICALRRVPGTIGSGQSRFVTATPTMSLLLLKRIGILDTQSAPCGTCQGHGLSECPHRAHSPRPIQRIWTVNERDDNKIAL